MQQPDYQVTQDCWTQMRKTETVKRTHSVSVELYSHGSVRVCCLYGNEAPSPCFFLHMHESPRTRKKAILGVWGGLGVHGHHGYFIDLFKCVVSAGKRNALKQHEFDWHEFLTALQPIGQI